MQQVNFNDSNQHVQDQTVNEQANEKYQGPTIQYIKDKKILYDSILHFLEIFEENKEETTFEDSEDCLFQELKEIISMQQILEDRDEMQIFLQTIKSICDNHHRNKNFINRIYRILENYKTQIKQTFSNTEIFHLFESNKMIVLFLLKNQIITLTESICEEMINIIDSKGDRYCYFFYPEIEKFIGEEKMNGIKNEILQKYPNAFDSYESKRQEGENDSYICTLIRNDSIAEFVSYVSQTNCPLSGQITPSLFETNPFLIKKENQTLIEYSAFFASRLIFNYLVTPDDLQKKAVNLTPSLWLYAIHSNDGELINLLVDKKVPPPSYTKDNPESGYLKCYFESIKCHHNNVANFFDSNYLLLNANIDQQQKQQKEDIKSLKYNNYEYLQDETIFKNGFCDLCLYNYNKLFNLFLEEKMPEIERKVI